MPRVSAPTLVIAGARDAAGVRDAEALVAALPQASLTVIPDAGADVHLEQPKAFNQALFGFLGD